MTGGCGREASRRKRVEVVGDVRIAMWGNLCRSNHRVALDACSRLVVSHWAESGLLPNIEPNGVWILHRLGWQMCWRVALAADTEDVGTPGQHWKADRCRATVGGGAKHFKT